MTLYGTASWYRKNAALYKELQSGPTKTEFPKTEHRFEVLDLEGGAVRGVSRNATYLSNAKYNSTIGEV